MAEPKISVILPFFNAEATLSFALESLANQTFPDFEVILVNNNSSDKSPEIAQKFCTTDSRFKLFCESRQGVVYAANTAASHAKGKYIARIDADDLALPQRLEKQFGFLETHPQTGLVGTNLIYRSHIPHTKGFKLYVQWLNSLKNADEIRQKRFIELPIANPTTMFRSETMRQHGLYRKGNFPEDYEMVLRWLNAGVQIDKMPDRLLIWNDYPQRLTRTNPDYSKDAFFEVKARYLAKWLEKHNPFHPEIWVWGASRLARRRSEKLEKYGIKIVGRIDIVEKPDNPDCFLPRQLPPPTRCFVVSYVAARGANRLIAAELNQKGFAEGENFMFAT